LRAIATATVTATAALGALVALGALCGTPLLIPPLAASMALIAGAPALPLSQPRSVIGGQALSALVGVAIGAVSHSLWAGALAGGLALGAMLLTRTAHSPAAATAVIGAMSTGSPGAFVACTAAAATVLVGFGLLGSALRGPAYPRYWW
jgi:CBS-domain-containing membrane protein